MLRRLIKSVAGRVLIPVHRMYLRKERNYAYRNISIKVLPGVFHPGLFHSTSFILDYLSKHPLQGKSVVEVGCGSGLIAIHCAKSGAKVTAIDLSEKAILNTSLNCRINSTPVDIVHSDLFDSVPKQTFDWIIINPPYYAKKAEREEDLAWNCGEDFQYFKKLFRQLRDYAAPDSCTIMVLTRGCDFRKILDLGENAGYSSELVAKNNVLFDGADYLFRISASTKH
jgi:release factor glutamine methyltransferase